MKNKLLIICLLLVTSISQGGELDGKKIFCDVKSCPHIYSKKSYFGGIGFEFIKGRVRSTMIHKDGKVYVDKNGWDSEYSTDNNFVYWWKYEYKLDRKMLDIYSQNEYCGVCGIMDSNKWKDVIDHLKSETLKKSKEEREGNQL